MGEEADEGEEGADRGAHATRPGVAGTVTPLETRFVCSSCVSFCSFFVVFGVFNFVLFFILFFVFFGECILFLLSAVGYEGLRKKNDEQQ